MADAVIFAILAFFGFWTVWYPEHLHTIVEEFESYLQSELCRTKVQPMFDYVLNSSPLEVLGGLVGAAIMCFGLFHFDRWLNKPEPDPFKWDELEGKTLVVCGDAQRFEAKYADRIAAHHISVCPTTDVITLHLNGYPLYVGVLYDSAEDS